MAHRDPFLGPSFTGAGSAMSPMVAVTGDREAERSEALPSDSHFAACARRPRLLVVEDEFLVGMELEDGLAEAGYEVAGVASSAEEAVMLAERERPLLVVMDIRLAGDRDGVDAAIEIRRRLDIPSLFASAHADSATLARAEAAAPLGWVVKPYRVSTIVEAVAHALDDTGGQGPDSGPTPGPA